MKLVLFGRTIRPSSGSEHATHWRGLCRALAARGHTLVFIERSDPFETAGQSKLPWRDGEWVTFAEWDDIAPLARRHLAEADAAIVASNFPDLVTAADLVISSSARVKAFYDLDSAATLGALARPDGTDFAGPRGLRDFDLVLSTSGGRALDELQARLGARRVAALYGCADPEAHRKVAPVEQFRCDLSYLGGEADDHQSALQTLLLEPAARLPGRRFLLAGAPLPASSPRTDNVSFVQHLEPAQQSAFFSSSRLTLHVTRRASKHVGCCPSVRLFEAAACGAPQLTDYWEGLDLFFEPGAEIIVARDSDEAMAAIALPYAALQDIARRARERVLDQHTARHRARELETLLESARSFSGAAALQRASDAVRTGGAAETAMGALARAYQPAIL